MKTKFWKVIVTLFIIIFLVSCNEEKELEAVSAYLYRTEEEYVVGEFNFEKYSFMVKFENDINKEVFLDESMLSNYDLLKLRQEGKHTITATIYGKKVEFTVDGKAKAITDVYVEPVVGVYTGESYSIQVKGNIPVGAIVSYPQGNSFVNAGTYDAVAVVSCENYKSLTLTTTVTIEKAFYDLSGIGFDNTEITYDGLEHSLKCLGTIPDGLKASYTISDKNVYTENDPKGNSAINAGKYYITLHLTGDKRNYETSNLTITKELTILPKPITLDTKDIHMDNVVVEYDGKFHSIEVDKTKLPEGVNVEYKNNNKIDAGEYVVQAIFTLEEEKNYTISNTMSATLTITKATYDMSGVKFENSTFDYNGLEHNITYSGTLPRGVELEYYENNGKVNAGTYEVIAHFTFKDKNHYEIAPMKATLTINKGSFTSVDLKLNSYSCTYDGQYHSLVLEGDIPVGVQATYKSWNEYNIDLGQTTQFMGVGIYTVIVEFKFERENYENYVEIPSLAGTLTINKRNLGNDDVVKVKDIECTYDGKNHGVKDEIDIPTWASIKSFNLVSQSGSVLTEAVDAGTYYFYYSIEYYDGEKTVAINSSTGKIIIHQKEIKINDAYTYQSSVTKIYDGQPLLSSITFKDSVAGLNVADYYSVTYYYLKSSTVREKVDAIVDVGTYEAVHVFGDSINYVWDKQINTTSITINASPIDMSQVEVENARSYDYDGLDYYPIVNNLPDFVKVNYELKNSELTGVSTLVTTYNVSFEANSSNYVLVNNFTTTAKVLYNQITFTVYDMGITFTREGSELSRNYQKNYASHSLRDEYGNPLAVESSFIGSDYYTYQVDANGYDIIFNANAYTHHAKDVLDSIYIEKYELYYVNSYNIGTLINSYDEFLDVANQKLFTTGENGTQFVAQNGTPYGKYYVFIKLSSDQMIRLASNTLVIEVNVNSKTFEPSSVFKTQTLEWKLNEETGKPYNYVINATDPIFNKEVIVDYNSSILSCSYDDRDISIHYNLNTNIYTNGGYGLEYKPTINIADKIIDLKGSSIRFSTIVYDENDHKDDWCNYDLYSNMNEETMELLKNGYITVEYDTMDGLPAIYPGSYNVVAKFSSNDPHISVINTNNTNNVSELYSLIIIQKKLITEEQILEGMKTGFVFSDNDKEDETNTVSTFQYYEKYDAYHNTVVYGMAMNDENLDYYLKFSRNETNGNYTTPTAGLKIASVDYTNEYGDQTLATTSSIKLNDKAIWSYTHLEIDPVIYEYIVIHFELDEYTSFANTSIRTYDVYVLTVEFVLDIDEDTLNLTYTGEAQSIYVKNQEEFSKALTFKYQLNDGDVTNQVAKVTDIGSYKVAIYAYYTSDTTNTCLGKVEKTIKVNKIIIDNNYLDEFLIKKVDVTGAEISSFTTHPGFRLPDHVYIEKYIYGNEELQYPKNFSSIGQYNVTVSLGVDDEDHYQLTDEAKTYSYTFEITKVHIIGYMSINGENAETSNPIVYSSDNAQVEFKFVSAVPSQFCTLTYSYKLNGGHHDVFSFPIVLNALGDVDITCTLDINSNYRDLYEVGYYNQEGEFVLSTGKLNATVIEKVDFDKVHMQFQNVDMTASSMGVVYGGTNQATKTIFSDVTVQYNKNGYSIRINPSGDYYAFTGAIKVDTVKGSQENGYVVSQGLQEVTEAGSLLYTLKVDDLVPGEYWITLMHDTAKGSANNYYINNSEYDTYLGIHLIIK